MFLRLKHFKNKDGSTRSYLQLVENIRVGNKTRQKVLVNLGRVDDLQNSGQIDRLIESLRNFSTKEWIRKEALNVNQTYLWGPVIIFEQLWKELGIERVLKRLLGDTDAVSDYVEAIFAMVLNRLVEPRSKRGVDRWVSKVYRPEFEQLSLQHYYRGLDYLEKFKEEVEEELFSNVKTLFNLNLDLVFWDTTSTYFQGEGPELSMYGRSKDHRSDCKQVMIGVLMTKDGFPVAHQIFPGNTADIDTFRIALEDIRRRFNIDRVIVVADRGMISNGLIEEIDKTGLSYIFGVKMRRSKRVEAVLNQPGDYEEVEENLKVKEVLHEGERYVICFNPFQAERDRIKREEIVKNLTKKLKQGPKSLVGNRGYRRYLSMQKTDVKIDQEKMASEVKYDGKYVLRTNTKLTNREVAQSYKLLWKVERAFRELKSGLDLRPIYHYTDTRVKGHIMICFLALVMETALCRKLKEIGSTFSYAEILEDLKEIRAVEITAENKRFLARTENNYGQCLRRFQSNQDKTAGSTQRDCIIDHCGGMSVFLFIFSLV